MACLYTWAMQTFGSLRVWSEHEIFQKLRSETGDYSSWIQYIADDDITFIDDLGSQSSTNWRNDCMFAFIQARYNGRKPTVISTNLSKKQMEEHFGAPTAERIFAKENTIVDFANEPNFRDLGL